MSVRQTDSRQRVVEAAAGMLARHGLNATSIREMARRAEAPLGSTYHHFPAGKTQVIVEAVDFAGAYTAQQLQRHLQAGLFEGVAGFIAMWRETLLRSNLHIGCPVLAVAVEEPLDEVAEEAQAAAARAFEDWQRILCEAFAREGLTGERAVGLATLVVASVEGAIAMARAYRRIEPFDRVAARLEPIIRQALADCVE